LDPGSKACSKEAKAVHEVDLRTTDVDRPHAARLRVPYPIDRLLLSLEEMRLTLALIVHGQGSRRPVAASRRPLSTRPIAFLLQTAGDAVPRFGGNQCRAANRAVRHRADPSTIVRTAREPAVHATEQNFLPMLASLCRTRFVPNKGRSHNRNVLMAGNEAALIDLFDCFRSTSSD
jgi:hypothetical protein